MFFNRKNTFFLELDKDTDSPKDLKPAKIVEAQKQLNTPTVVKKVSSEKLPAPTQIKESQAIKSDAITTAEAIAIELRDIQENRPVISNVTFAPENLQPSGMKPLPRRQPGANLGNFKTMASDMFKI
uniref:Uncharacterized protein n=1 Tax=Paulinella longichromatophora TaxID=1708747 RepID=A0A2H4ZQ70_9EUKA|nr:hypothetical protein PLO_700 [Paulinella longichromatophora]